MVDELGSHLAVMTMTLPLLVGRSALVFDRANVAPKSLAALAKAGGRENGRLPSGRQNPGRYNNRVPPGSLTQTAAS
ncbi:MAG: hypothetical protein ACO1SV_10560 [Fimbriimonas sp.]